MPTLLTFPEAVELLEVEQSKLPVLTMVDPIFDMFPIVNRDAAHVAWEQEDDFRGLMQGRGVNGPAVGIQMVGSNSYQMDPGRYSEFVILDEKKIEARRQLGSYDGIVSINDLVYRAQDRLLDRRISRIKWILWTLLATGAFTVPGPNGSVVHKDQYAFQTQTASVAWATYATATPIKDFRAAKLKARGKSVRFDATSKAYMNQSTFNDLLANTNSADIAGKRIENGATVNSKDNFDAILLANDLPTIVIHDDGYFTDAGVFTPWIPNNTVILVGNRIDASQVGEFQMTRNVMNENIGPGPYTIVSDSAQGQGGLAVVPRVVKVDDGFNGGPAIFFPGAIIVMTV